MATTTLLDCPKEWPRLQQRRHRTSPLEPSYKSMQLFEFERTCFSPHALQFTQRNNWVSVPNLFLVACITQDFCTKDRRCERTAEDGVPPMSVDSHAPSAANRTASS